MWSRLLPFVLLTGLLSGCSVFENCSSGMTCVAETKPGKIKLPAAPGSWEEASRAGVTGSGTERSLPGPPQPATFRLDDTADLERRDGASWTPVKLPRPSLPDEPEGHEASVVLTSLVELSPTDVWAAGSISYWLCCDSFSHDRPLAFHYDGASWTEQAPRIKGTAFTAAAPDGSGGVWFGTNRPHLLHYASGTWTTSALPLPDWHGNEDSMKWHVKEMSRASGDLLLVAEGNGTEPDHLYRFRP